MNFGDYGIPDAVVPAANALPSCMITSKRQLSTEACLEIQPVLLHGLVFTAEGNSPLDRWMKEGINALLLWE